MKRRSLALLALLVPAFSQAAAATDIKLGLAAPLTGPLAILGEQLRAGANAAAGQAGVTLLVADDTCTAEGGAAAAEAFIAAKVSVATGFLCTEAIEAALPLLKDAGIPTLDTGVRTDSLTDSRFKTGWLVARLAPRADAESAAVAAIIGERWRGELFAIVDDGTVYSRDLAEGLRNAVEQAGLKPVFTDTFRPQLDNQIGLVGRLRRAGATHVFVAGDRSDIAIIGRDAAVQKAPLVIAGGEVLRAARDEVDLAEGTLMVGLPEWTELAGPETVARLRQSAIEPDGYVLPAYASVEIAAEAARRAAANGGSVIAAIEGEEFATVIGTIGFTANGDRADNPYRLFRYTNGHFSEVE